MGRPLAPIDPLAAPFGYELRRWRLRRQLALKELADRLHHSGSYLSQIEHGRLRPTRRLAEATDQLLDASGALVGAYEHLVSGPRNRRDEPHEFRRLRRR